MDPFYVGLMLKIVDISKAFSSQFALKNVSLEIRDGELFSLLGPSGCGKTTLLRIVAGFEEPSSGQIFWDDVRIDCIKPQDRPFNMVFQKYAFFPHLNVFANVAYGLQVKGADKKAIRERVTEALSLVGLGDFHHRMPETLSGGQAQRVALARAVVNKPKILLLDEPLSALDQKMREHMQTELRELQRRVGITFIFVTHDQEEAMALSDRVAVMNKGRLEQVSTPQELYSQPQTLFVAQFIGASGSVRGQLKVGQPNAGHPNANQKDGLHELITPSGHLICGIYREPRPDSSASPDTDSTPQRASNDVVAIVRPEKIQVRVKNELFGPSLQGQPTNSVRGVIRAVIYKGAQRELQVETADHDKIRVFLFEGPSSSRSADLLKKNETAEMLFSVHDTFIFPASES